MKKIIITLYALITTITLIGGTYIIAAQEPYRSNPSTEEMVILGNYIASEVTLYLRENSAKANVINSLTNIRTSDDAVKTALSMIRDAIKNDNAFMTTQMLGTLLNDLNGAYNTNFKTEEIIHNISHPIPASQENIGSKKPNQNIQIWMSKMWENIQYYMNRAYETGKSLIGRQ